MNMSPSCLEAHATHALDAKINLQDSVQENPGRNAMNANSWGGKSLFLNFSSEKAIRLNVRHERLLATFRTSPITMGTCGQSHAVASRSASKI